MAETYTLKDMELAKDMPGYAKGPAKVLALTLEDPKGETHQAELFTMASTPLPTVGEKIEGTIESSDYGPKFRRGDGQRRGGAPGKSPAQEKRIVRQHSQEQAIRICAIIGRVPDEESFINLVNWFEDDAFGKLKSGTNRWPMNSDVPVDTKGL